MKNNFNSLNIYDDTFTTNVNWVMKFCDEYEKKIKRPFFFTSRANIICQNEDMIKRLREVGGEVIAYGGESGNQRMLNFLRKGTTVEQNIEAARICKKYKYKLLVSFMFGLPTETNDEMLDTLRVIKKINPDFTNLSYFIPLPGTDLYDYCIENDLSLVKKNDYTRGVGIARIRGVDYRFVNWVYERANRLSFKRKFFRRIPVLFGLYGINLFGLFYRANQMRMRLQHS